MRKIFSALIIVALCTSCSRPAAGPVAPPTAAIADTSASDADAHKAHEAYVAAINSNNLDSILGMLTEDVVFMAPNEKPYIGKAALRPWLEGYISAYKTHWDKPVQEFIVNGDWAFERYSYTSTDTPLSGGTDIVGTGWGLVIYHHDKDGTWRVARDAWGSDQAVAAE